MKNTLLFLFAALFIFAGPVFSGEYNISLHKFYNNNNIDVYSYPNQMLLKHSFSQFYRLPKNPILTVSRNQWDARDVADPYIVVTDTNILMFYDGDNNDRYSIGYARLSNDSWFWEKKGVALKPSANNWESYHVIDPVVILLEEKWYMWYSGNKDDLPFGYNLGLAQSNDGLKWKRKQQQPILSSSAESWDFYGVAYADVNYDYQQNKFKMWYSGFFGPFASIGYAESSDGIIWQKQFSKPVYAVAPGIIAPEVVYNGEKYMMWYAQLNLQKGMRTHIALAESREGIEWKFVKNVLSAQAKWEGKKLMSPAITFINQKVRLFYCAQSGSKWLIGEAFAIPKFESSGVWISDIITRSNSQLNIVYEQPLNTELSISINIDNNFQQLTPISGENLAYNRKRGKYILPPIDGKNIQIKIEMISNNSESSPVVYSLKLSD